jgi:hypothetical protein
MTGLPLGGIAGHMIRTLTAESQPGSRSYLVSVRCACGSEFPGVITADFSGVLDVGFQMFVSHLAGIAAVE